MPYQSTLPFETHSDAAYALARLRDVPPRAGHWDELRDATGSLREPWQRFFGGLGADGVAGLDVAYASVARQIRDNDITYNVYAENGGPRPWVLDALPFIVEEHEWSAIERGVAQRARLLDALVADVYGPQSVLARGLLPPALVFGNPGYLRALKGYRPAGGRYLRIVAVDLARAPDGAWTVIGHRAQAPSGLGYALENRLIASNLFAEPYRAMRVRRLAPFYAELIAALAGAASATMDAQERRRRGDSPHIALLSPGPYSETYFEHAFLARYLGLTLVEGTDLTVRDDKLYLKTLAGLERVHGLLRRLDDTFCDPVELRADSTIGVPGLLQVMRAGNVAVSNVPGAGFVESPALHGFLPALAKALLGETLALPSVPTWWCGEAPVMADAFEQLQEAWLLPTWPRADATSPEPSPPRANAGWVRLDAWKERIARHPDAFTVQAPLPYSCMPHYRDGALWRRACALRAYAIAGVDGQWHVLPGSFTRVAGEGQASLSMHAGGSTVDTWVLSSHAAPASSLLPTPMQPHDIARHERTVSSRAAENLFWAGRYGERAENNVRLSRLILGSLDSLDDDEMLVTLAELAARSELIPAGIDTLARSTRQAFERTLVANLHERSGCASVGQILANQARACGEIRARLSNDHWRAVLASRNDFRDALRALSLAPEPGDRSSVAPMLRGDRHESYERLALMRVLETLAMQLSAISGAQGDRMVRDDAWRLLFVGRHIERVTAMSTLLRAVAASGMLATPAAFDVLLQLFDSTLTYRSLYPGRYEVPALLHLLVVDPTNPRGLYGVYDRLSRKIAQIAERSGNWPVGVDDLLPPVSTLPDLPSLCQAGGAGRFDTLLALCDRLSEAVGAASTAIGGRYFTHASPMMSRVSG